MATWTSKSGVDIELSADHLVGRSTRAQTRIDDPRVSAQHAAIRWVGHEWRIRDLGSRNGTWLGTMRLPAQQWVPLDQDRVVCFGDPGANPFTLVDPSPPRPCATHPAGVVRGDGQLLALPSEDHPLALLTYGDDGWVIRTGEDVRSVVDGEEVEVEGTRYVLALPEPVVGTTDIARTDATTPGLELRVSADQEYIEVGVRWGSEAVAVRPKVHHELLLVLARARIDDRARGMAAEDQGWLHNAELAQQLRVTKNQLYVMKYRCRRDMEALREGAGRSLLEKRTTTRQVRIGWPRLSVGRL